MSQFRTEQDNSLLRVSIELWKQKLQDLWGFVYRFSRFQSLSKFSLVQYLTKISFETRPLKDSMYFPNTNSFTIPLFSNVDYDLWNYALFGIVPEMFGNPHPYNYFGDFFQSYQVPTQIAQPTHPVAFNQESSEKKQTSLDQREPSSFFKSSKSVQLQKSEKITANKNRNVVPNILHQILTFITKEKKSGKIVIKILRKHGCPEALRPSYYTFVRDVKTRMKRYISLESFMKSLRPGFLESETSLQKEQQILFCKVARILTKHFLKNYSVLVTMSSAKIKKENWFQHFVYINRILESLSTSDQVGVLQSN